MSIDGDVDFIKCTRIDPIIYALISNKLATLAEIRDAYTCDEILDLFELYTVKAYNKNSIHKSTRR